MIQRTTPDGLREGDRIRLLPVEHWRDSLDADAMAVLEAAVGGIHPLDTVDEDGFGWIAIEVAPDHWHSFKLDADDYEKAD